MGKLLPIAVVLVAAAGGSAGGYFLRTPPPEEEAPAETLVDVAEPVEAAPDEEAFVTFRDGFIVPVLRDGIVWSHVILMLGVEAQATSKETMFLREPILRDGLTQALFLHASLGGFDGDFTDALSMERLRTRLSEVLSRKLSDDSARVLIVSMARQVSG